MEAYYTDQSGKINVIEEESFIFYRVTREKFDTEINGYYNRIEKVLKDILDFIYRNILKIISISYGPDHAPLGYKVYYHDPQTGQTRPFYYIRKEDK